MVRPPCLQMGQIVDANSRHHGHAALKQCGFAQACPSRPWTERARVPVSAVPAALALVLDLDLGKENDSVRPVSSFPYGQSPWGRESPSLCWLCTNTW
jgi:hypothetical protein